MNMLYKFCKDFSLQITISYDAFTNRMNVVFMDPESGVETACDPTVEDLEDPLYYIRNSVFAQVLDHFNIVYLNKTLLDYEEEYSCVKEDPDHNKQESQLIKVVEGLTMDNEYLRNTSQSMIDMNISLIRSNKELVTMLANVWVDQSGDRSGLLPRPAGEMLKPSYITDTASMHPDWMTKSFNIPINTDAPSTLKKHRFKEGI